MGTQMTTGKKRGFTFIFPNPCLRSYKPQASAEVKGKRNCPVSYLVILIMNTWASPTSHIARDREHYTEDSQGTNMDKNTCRMIATQGRSPFQEVGPAVSERSAGYGH